jgi:hypothetical protein
MDSRAGGTCTGGRGVRTDDHTGGADHCACAAHGGASGEANDRASRGANHSCGSSGSRADDGIQAS